MTVYANWLIEDPPGRQAPQGLSYIERDEKYSWRWATAPKVVLSGLRPGNLLAYEIKTAIPGQKVEVLDGETVVTVHESNGSDVAFSGRIAVSLSGTIQFRPSDWNHGKGEYHPNDPRPLAFSFLVLREVPGNKAEKICVYPFSLATLPVTRFVPCCAGWLEGNYYQIECGQDPWNGPAAMQLRHAILNGDYRYCRREVCHKPLYTVDELDRFVGLNGETPISPGNLDAIRRGIVHLPDGPSSVSVNTDPRCNLVCASCRKKPIHTLTPEESAAVAKTEADLIRYRNSLEAIKLAGDGEVFFSPFLRQTLKELTPERYPRLRFLEILSNGQLVNERNMEQLRPGTDYIHTITISVDAGTKKVYEKVRGGDWDNLLSNLHWLGIERRKGRFKAFYLSFTARRSNFRSLPDYVQVGRSVGADAVAVTVFDNWGRMAVRDYLAEAVHLPDHPLFPEFRQVIEQLRKIKDYPVGIYV